MKKIFISLFAVTFCLNVFAQDANKKSKTEPKEKTQAEKDKKIITTKEKRDVKPKKKGDIAKPE